AGAIGIGRFVYEWLGSLPEKADITLYESFAQTYQGHGTDKALLGGLMGMATDDVRIKHALELAEEHNMNYAFHLEDKCPYYDHPNIALIEAKQGETSVTAG